MEKNYGHLKKVIQHIYSETEKFSTTYIAEAPSRPSGQLTLTKPAKDSVTLNWSPPKKDGRAPIKSYKIEVSNDGKTWKDLDTTDKLTTQYTAKNLETGKDYYFRVSAVNDIGPGEPLKSDLFKPTKPIG